jgi:hypothetical protein
MMLRSPSQAEHDLRNHLAGTKLGNGPPPKPGRAVGSPPIKSAVGGVVATQRINVSAVRQAPLCRARAPMAPRHRPDTG